MDIETGIFAEFVQKHGSEAVNMLFTQFNKGISYDQEVKYDIECLSDNVPMISDMMIFL